MITSWITSWICAIWTAGERSNVRTVLDIYATITMHWIAVCHPKDQERADKDRSEPSSSDSIFVSIQQGCHHIATSICTGNYSTAVVPCIQFCNDHCVTITVLESNLNCDGKPLVRRSEVHYADNQWVNSYPPDEMATISQTTSSDAL